MLMIAGSLGDVLACAVMLFAWWRSPCHAQAPSRRQWLFMALLFAALAIEKALQLDAFVHDAMRALATRNEVYGSRRGAQVAVVLLAVVGIAGAMVHSLKRERLPAALWRIRFFGFLLLGLDGIRAVSLHQIDQILFASVWRLHLNHVLEGGLTLIILYHTARWLRAGEAIPGPGDDRVRRRRRERPVHHHKTSDQQIKRRNKS